MKRGALLTIANAVSVSRLVLAAAFIAATSAWQRLALVIVAGLTDFFDGWIARRQHQESRLGALLDPVADRAFVITAVAVYLAESLISTTEFFVILARDFATVFGFVVARIVPSLRSAVFQARPLGKSVTVLQLSLLIVVLILPVLADFLMLAIGVLSAASIVDYTMALWRARAR